MMHKINLEETNKQIANIGDELFVELQKYLLKHLGLNLQKKQRKELLKKMRDAAQEFSFDDLQLFINWILQNHLSSKGLELLASFLTVGETYFLREIKGFDFLQFVHLPKLRTLRVEKSRKIRIWSAGCSSGEEVYSLAFIVSKVYPDYKNWDIKIIGTDINPVAIDKAKNGLYSKWSFRNCSQEFKQKYFNEENELLSVKSEFREMVEFRTLNLIKSDFSDLMNNEQIDIILCRNVMIYFSQDIIEKLAKRFHNKLNENGVLLVSSVEMNALNSSSFYRTNYEGITVFHKTLPKGYKKSERKSLTPKTEAYLFAKKRIKKPIINTRKIKNKSTETISYKQLATEQKTTSNQFDKALDLYNNGRYIEAQKTFAEIGENKNKRWEEANYYLIKCIAKSGNYIEAFKRCEVTIKQNKFDSKLHYLLGTICIELKNNVEAMHAFKKAIYLESDFVLAHYMLGILLKQNGNQTLGRKHQEIAGKILSKLNPETILFESDGITSSKFAEMTGL